MHIYICERFNAAATGAQATNLIARAQGSRFTDLYTDAKKKRWIETVTCPRKLWYLCWVSCSLSFCTWLLISFRSISQPILLAGGSVDLSGLHINARGSKEAWIRDQFNATPKLVSINHKGETSKWHDMTRNDTRWHGMTRNDTKWHEMTRHDTKWQDMFGYFLLKFGFVCQSCDFWEPVSLRVIPCQGNDRMHFLRVIPCHGVVSSLRTFLPEFSSLL
jgi:hypothetical protein